MTAYIDIITGFLESGKTTFIKKLWKSHFFESFNQIVLLVCEEGFTEYEEEELKEKNVKIVYLEEESELGDELFPKIWEEYNPDYMLVEYNGTWDISKILRLKVPFGCQFRNIISVSEAGTFRSQLSNMALLMQPHILNSNVVVFNRFEERNPDFQKKLILDVKNINPRTKITFLKAVETDKILKEHFLEFGDEENTSLNFKMNVKAGIFMMLCLAFVIVFHYQKAYENVQSIVIVFLSILMQAVPFILFGAFISAGIQIFVSTGWIMKHMEKGNWSSFLLASIAGFFMPTCDCGIVPVVSGLLKKDTPLPQTITFWLASSAVSPIVLLSMLYAFPDQPYLALIRMAAGIVIGVMCGMILKWIPLETKDVVKENRRLQNIGKDILELKNKGIKGKIEAVFAGAKAEFFRVFEYVIIGALISSVLQTVMPQAMKTFLNSNLMFQFLIMVVAAIFMSTCSTSNAFIGRSFSNNFSIVSILAFIVMGPMLDLKNMVMLSEILTKKFLLLLACMVMIESALIFSILAFFL